MKIGMCFVWGFALALGTFSEMAEPIRQLVAHSVSVPMKTDGEYEEQAYVSAAWSDDFAVMDPESKDVNALYLEADRKFTSLRTRVAAFFDARCVSFCLVAPYPSDVPPTDDESFEFHLKGDGNSVFRVAVDMRNAIRTVQYDAVTMRESAWKTEAVSGLKKAGGETMVEVSIPFSDLGFKKSPESLSCNFIRRGASTGGVSSWRQTNRGLPDPQKFGVLFFGTVRNVSVGPALAANVGKKVLFWGDDPWSDSGPLDVPPVDKPELGEISLTGPRGARAVTAFRVSNLTDRHALYNISVEAKGGDVARRIRLRELGCIELRGGEIIPDPLFDLPIGSVLRLAPRSTTIIWLDTDFSGLSSGSHTANLRFAPGYSQFETKSLPVRLLVGKADVSEIKMPVHYYHQRSDRTTAVMAKEYGFNVVVINSTRFPFATDGKTVDFARADAAVDAFLEAGIPRDELFVRLDLQLPGWAMAGFTKEQKRRLKFLDPEWKRLTTERITKTIEHLTDKYGIGYDRVEVKVKDEPGGDPDDPKSSFYGALKSAEFLKAANPRLRVGSNFERRQFQYLQRFIDTFDLLEPDIRGLMDGRIDRSAADRLRASGRKISSYVVYVKQNTPHQYRRGFWSNLNYGFDGYFAVYGLVAASGDPFNSYDYKSPKSKCRSDWNTAYENPRTGQITAGRRMEAWYQGLVDMKLVKWCRKRIEGRASKGEDMSWAEREIEELIKSADQPFGDLTIIRTKLFSLSEKL